MVPIHQAISCMMKNWCIFNICGNHFHPRHDLPTWCAHPLKVPSSQPTMLLFPGDMTHYAGMLAACRQLPAVQESWIVLDDLGAPQNPLKMRTLRVVYICQSKAKGLVAIKGILNRFHHDSTFGSVD